MQCSSSWYSVCSCVGHATCWSRLDGRCFACKDSLFKAFLKNTFVARCKDVFHQWCKLIHLISKFLNQHNFDYSKLGKFFSLENLIMFLLRSCDLFRSFKTSSCLQSVFRSTRWCFRNFWVKHTFLNWDDVELQLLEWDSPPRIIIDLQFFSGNIDAVLTSDYFKWFQVVEVCCAQESIYVKTSLQSLKPEGNTTDSLFAGALQDGRRLKQT